MNDPLIDEILGGYGNQDDPNTSPLDRDGALEFLTSRVRGLGWEETPDTAVLAQAASKAGMSAIQLEKFARSFMDGENKLQAIMRNEMVNEAINIAGVKDEDGLKEFVGKFNERVGGDFDFDDLGFNSIAKMKALMDKDPSTATNTSVPASGRAFPSGSAQAKEGDAQAVQKNTAEMFHPDYRVQHNGEHYGVKDPTDKAQIDAFVNQKVKTKIGTDEMEVPLSQINFKAREIRNKLYRDQPIEHYLDPSKEAPETMSDIGNMPSGFGVVQSQEPSAT